MKEKFAAKHHVVQILRLCFLEWKKRSARWKMEHLKLRKAQNYRVIKLQEKGFDHWMTFIQRKRSTKKLRERVLRRNNLRLLEVQSLISITHLIGLL